MENKTKNDAPVPAVEAGDRKASGLVRPITTLESFAGWGPRLEGSIRDVLRGLN